MGSKLSDLNINRRSFTLFVIAISVFFYFIFYTIFGNRGIVDYFSVKQNMQGENLIKNTLFIQIQDQQNRVDRMKNESLDIDLLDEQVRQNLGYAKKNEIIIYENKDTSPGNK